MHGEVLHGKLRLCTNNHPPSLPTSPTHRPSPHRHTPLHPRIIEEHHVWGMGCWIPRRGLNQVCLHCGQTTVFSRNHKRQFSLEPRSACSPWPRARVLGPTLANRTSLHDDASSSMRCQTGSPIAAHGWIAPLRLRSHSTRRLCAGDSSSALCSALPQSISNKATHSALNAAVPQ